MFSSIRGFLGRHKRKFIISGMVVGGAVLVVRYVGHKLEQWREEETTEILERAQRRSHFESTERTCDQTIVSLAPTVQETICGLTDTDRIVEQLKTAQPDQKLELWAQLKVLTFTRACVLAYGGAMLVATLRVQLSVIGGYMYQDHAGPGRVSSALQESYLSLCHHFLSHGVKELCTLIQDKVVAATRNLSLKQKLTLQDVEQLFWTIQAQVATDTLEPLRNMSRYVLLPALDALSYNLSDHDSEVLARIAAETADILDSDEVASVASSSVAHAFSALIDGLCEGFCAVRSSKESLNDPVPGHSRAPPRPNGTLPFSHPNAVLMPLAKLIPLVNSVIHNFISGDRQAPWLYHHLINDKFKVLSANIYEAFCQKP
ncbi:peroxisomal biogenesis factor 3 [Bacillus rossius redtenbacheri]|uniref:peroxisomal biogenesis factor 3 n=1 Tax=Bacillus rossius redtenbacheri TaxID=93214 RepID=UPI002FDE1A48